MYMKPGIVANISINKDYAPGKRKAYVLCKAVDQEGNPSLAAVWLKTDGTFDRSISIFVLTRTQLEYAEPLFEATLFANSDNLKAPKPIKT